MKKILFSAVSLDMGGIETALVALINYLADIKENNDYKYNITLVLEKKQGIFLDIINKRISIIEYTPNSNKNIILRKCFNFVNQIKFIHQYKNKFKFSASYATYSCPASFVARTASKNSVLWCHMDYLGQFENNKKKVKEFFNEKKYKQFKKMIFVSEKSKDTFLEVFPKMKDKVEHINNFINDEEIKLKAAEKIDLNFEKDLEGVIFINIGRHDENQKKLTRLIKVAENLKKQNLKFTILLVGDGEYTNEYKKLVEKYKLKNNIIFLGKKKNPYPYLKLSDCLVLTSDYEGSPVVFTEAMVLNKPIITTNVAGSEQINNNFGYIANMDATDITEKMKNVILNGYKIKNKFDAPKYNDEIKNKINKIIGEG